MSLYGSNQTSHLQGIERPDSASNPHHRRTRPRPFNPCSRTGLILRQRHRAGDPAISRRRRRTRPAGERPLPRRHHRNPRCPHRPPPPGGLSSPAKTAPRDSATSGRKWSCCPDGGRKQHGRSPRGDSGFSVVPANSRSAVCNGHWEHARLDAVGRNG